VSVSMLDMVICRHCGEPKRLNQMRREKGRVQRVCLACRYAAARQRPGAAEARKRYYREYRRRHADQVRESQRRYREQYREAFNAYHREYQRRLRERRKESRP
jgi:hypothetical protein